MASAAICISTVSLPWPMSEAPRTLACMSPESPAVAGDAPAGPRVVPPNGMRTFLHVLINTAVANITTSFLWFALTFWVYLETRSVLATGIIGGAYMLLLALFGMVFGTFVDRHRKHRVMVLSGLVTLAAFILALAAFPGALTEALNI